MGSRLDNATHYGLRAARTMAGVSVTYSDGAGSVSLTAVVGETDWDETDASGDVISSYQSRDFIFLLSDLDDLTASLPDRGHTIVDADGYTYTLMAPTGLKPWRWADRNRKWIRVHTKKTADP